MKKRLLALSWYGSANPVSGERVRFARILDELAPHYDLTCLTFESGSVSPSSPNIVEMRAPQSLQKSYEVGPLDYLVSTLRGAAIEEAILGSRDRRRWTANILKSLSPDIVLANQPYVWSLVPNEFKSRTVLDTHNVNSARLERILESLPSLSPRRILLRRQVALTRAFEARYCRDAGAVWCVSTEDLALLPGPASSVQVVENGAVHVEEASRRPLGALHDPVRLLFFGTLDYSANLDGLKVLLDWVSELRRPWELVVAGSGDQRAAKAMLSKCERATLVGRVRSPGDVMRGCDALVVPHRQGGGSRLKIAEAMAHGLPVISTRVGAEGLSVVPGIHYLEVQDGAGLDTALGSLSDQDRLLELIQNGLDRSRALEWREIVRRARPSLDGIAC